MFNGYDHVISLNEFLNVVYAAGKIHRSDCMKYNVNVVVNSEINIHHKQQYNKCLLKRKTMLVSSEETVKFEEILLQIGDIEQISLVDVCHANFYQAFFG